MTEGKRGASELVALAQGASTTEAAVALAALAELDHPAVNGTLREALARPDVGVLAAASTAIASRALDTRLRDPLAIAPLAKVVRSRDEVAALEGRLGALEALGRLVRPETGKEKLKTQAPSDAHLQLLREVVVPLARHGNVTVRRAARETLSAHPQFGAELAAMMPLPATSPAAEEVRALVDVDMAGIRGLRVNTDAGSFLVDFQGVDAPLNQRHLTTLARAQFYEGLGWHRVVPGFVVQGGDPRGDGYGGPGYLVPCEYSNLRYERGAVGIATAGRDTGGSQLFVTHAATPHLDGRYTVVGFVSPEDMSVVERILPDDRIRSVE
ncbi:MAG: peptidylprolyl isomerase, partial [Nannocystaceae bacterium]